MKTSSIYIAFLLLAIITYTSAMTPLSSISSESRLSPPAPFPTVEWQTFLSGSQVQALALTAPYLWVGAEGDGLFRLDIRDGSYIQYLADDSLADNRVNALAIDGEGRLWVGTEGGLSVFDGGRWTTYTTENSGLADNYINALAIDRKGRVLVGSRWGVSEWADGIWNSYPVIDVEKEGYGPYEVLSIAVDTAGRKWFGTRFGGVHVLDGQEWRPYNPDNSDLIDNTVQAIVIAEDGRIWLGTPRGVSVFDGFEWTNYTRTNAGLSGDRVQALAIDDQGCVWAGTDWGVSIFNGAGWLVLQAKDSGLPRDEVQAIAFDERGQVWIGMDRGLAGTETVVAVAAASPLIPPVLRSMPVEPPLRQSWKATFRRERGVVWLLSAGDAVYIITMEGIVHALEADSGRELWQTAWWESPSVQRCPYDPPILKGAWGYYYFDYRGDRNRLTLADGVLVAGFCTGWTGFESEILAVFLDAASGEIRWTRPLANGSVVGAAGDLMILNDEAGVLAIDVKTGGPTWRVERGDLKLLWAQALAEDVVLTLEAKKVSDYEESRSVAAYNLADGSLRWVLTRPEGLFPRATAGGRWFDISDHWTMDEGQLLAFDVLSGEELWTASLAWIEYGATDAEIIAHEDKVFIFGTWEEIGLTAYDATTGYRLWTALEGVNGRKVGVLADTVYFLGTTDEVGHLYTLNPANGAVEWSGFDGLNIAFMAADQERLYLVTSSGLYADAVLTAYEPRPR